MENSGCVLLVASITLPRAWTEEVFGGASGICSRVGAPVGWMDFSAAMAGKGALSRPLWEAGSLEKELEGAYSDFKFGFYENLAEEIDEFLCCGHPIYEMSAGMMEHAPGRRAGQQQTLESALKAARRTAQECCKALESGFAPGSWREPVGLMAAGPAPFYASRADGWIGYARSLLSLMEAQGLSAGAGPARGAKTPKPL